jgi:endonuclease/exonuclease/phosphatase family metal-dependent hydrolase
MDYGMARSGNINTTRYIAEQLGSGYAFAVEFVELGLGNDQETALFKGQTNSHGYHGNAIISSRQFRDPQVIPVGEPGSWFSHDWHHRRLGRRNGVMVTVELDGVPIKLISVHLENLSTPDQRRDQMLRILEHLDTNEPAVIAGDLNTSALPDMSAESDWYNKASDYEPLFEMMSRSGFDWKKVNTPDQTRRIINDGRPLPLPRRIDWFFVRGFQASNPITWPAESENGLVLSDHELITVDLSLS